MPLLDLLNTEANLRLRTYCALALVGASVLLAFRFSEKLGLGRTDATALGDIHLSNSDLRHFKDRALRGDCPSAQRVARHYSMSMQDIQGSLEWLRISARCGDPRIAVELAVSLAYYLDAEGVANEYAAVLSRLQSANPALASEVEETCRQIYVQKGKDLALRMCAGRRLG